MNEAGGNGQGTQVDVNQVMANLQRQVGQMAGELALRDAYIAQLEARIAELEPAGSGD